RDPVKLVRIDHELGVDAETAQRRVHLLASLDRHVEIALTAQKKGRRLDAIGMQEGIRDLLISLPRFRIPGRANLVVVLDDVLIGPVKSDRKRSAGAAGRALEPRVSGDDLISENATITPTADAH